MDLKPGQNLGLYRITERLVSGGMAKVYRAMQISTGREVAIKVLPEIHADAQTLARFERETQLLAGLQHPHILSLIDAGREVGCRYLVLPLVRRGDLADLIAREDGPLPLPLVRRIALQLCEALEYAHAHGVIHRDLKPGNVLRDERDNCLLTDFGIALPEGAERLTLAGHAIGTLEYLAPEQASGVSDARSDLYALGVILFELVTGRLPFRAHDALQWLRLHREAPIPSPRSLNAVVPEALDAVIVKSLAKIPEQRFQSATEFAAALRAALPEAEYYASGAAGVSDAGDEIEPQSTTKATHHTRNRQSTRAVLLVLAGISIAAAGAWWLSRSGPTSNSARSPSASLQSTVATTSSPAAASPSAPLPPASSLDNPDAKYYDTFADPRFEHAYDPTRWKLTRADARMQNEQRDGAFHIRSQEREQGIYAEFPSTRLTKVAARLRFDAPVQASQAGLGISLSRLDHPGEWVTCYLYATRNASTAIPSCTDQRHQEFRTGTAGALGSWHEVALNVDADGQRVLVEADGMSLGELRYPGNVPPTTWYVLLSGWSADGQSVAGAIDRVRIEHNP